MDFHSELELKANIPFLFDAKSISPIHKGYSEDRKYIASKTDRDYLLRTFSIASYEGKRREFEALAKMKEMNIPSSR